MLDIGSRGGRRHLLKRVGGVAVLARHDFRGRGGDQTDMDMALASTIMGAAFGCRAAVVVPMFRGTSMVVAIGTGAKHLAAAKGDKQDDERHGFQNPRMELFRHLWDCTYAHPARQC